MAYSFRRKDGSVEQGVRRIARSQIDKAIIAIDEDSPADAVRKRCKRVRGLIRLVRPAFPEYAAENAVLRDVARLLVEYRDARVMLDAFDRLVDGEQSKRKALASLRKQIVEERKELLAGEELRDRFSDCRKSLHALRKRVPDWSLDAEGWDAVGPGLALSYSRAVTATRQGGDGPDYGEIRKRLKYHWMHVRLLHRMDPGELKQRAKTAKKVVDLLGAQRDLALFENRLKIDPDRYGQGDDVDMLGVLVCRQRTVLQERPKAMLGRLFTVDPDELVDAWGETWAAWQMGTTRHRRQIVELA